MTGTIKNINPDNRSGWIKAQNGQTVYFSGSAVWEHDYPFLAVGQTVSFDLLERQRPRAINVHLFEDRHTPRKPEHADGPAQLRFVGFNQANAIRTFHFMVVVAGKEVRDYTVTANMEMFWKHRVGIQEGPALCSRVVLAELAAVRGAIVPLTLTEDDILAHIASRHVLVRKKPHRRRPAALSQPAQ